MLRKEDSRRLAQLERQLWRDDPEFCARMTVGRPARKRMSLILIIAAVVIWTVALVLGVVGWWIAAAVAAACATAAVVAIAYRIRPGRRTDSSGPLPPAW
jgi:Flp pilus assembly protein TadB